MKLRMMYRHEETLFRFLNDRTYRAGLIKYSIAGFRDEAVFTLRHQRLSWNGALLYSVIVVIFVVILAGPSPRTVQIPKNARIGIHWESSQKQLQFSAVKNRFFFARPKKAKHN